MKIIHFSDTHLGFSDLDILNEDNINQREADFYDAFNQVVEYIKTSKPDFIIHTGDLFHRVSPTNRAISFALSKFNEINQLNIPFIVIAGNHSTPRTNLSSPILKIFENFENIYLSYNQEYKKFEFDNIVFHTIPHLNNESRFENELDKCEQNIANKKNILMLHCSVGENYLMKEFGEFVYPKEKEYLFEKMDYVALGHWHGFKKVKENVYYSGSTEATSLNDRREKGFIELNDFKVNFISIKTRKIVTKIIDCEDFVVDTTNTKEAIVEVILENLTPAKSLEISNIEIKEQFKEAMSVIIKRVFKDDKIDYNEIESHSLEESFLDMIKDDENYLDLEAKIKELFRKVNDVSK